MLINNFYTIFFFFFFMLRWDTSGTGHQCETQMCLEIREVSGGKWGWADAWMEPWGPFQQNFSRHMDWGLLASLPVSLARFFLYQVCFIKSQFCQKSIFSKTGLFSVCFRCCHTPLTSPTTILCLPPPPQGTWTRGRGTKGGWKRGVPGFHKTVWLSAQFA